MANRSIYALALSELRTGLESLRRPRNLDVCRRAVAAAAEKAVENAALTGHRAAAVEAVARHLREGGTRSLVVIPANGDRERLFPAIVAASGGRSGFPNTVVLTPTIDSVASLVRDLRATVPAGIPVGYMASRGISDADGAAVPRAFALVTVMTYAGFAQAAETGAVRAGDVDHLVLNEAHQGLSDFRQEKLVPFIRSAVVSAFTGTPAFDDFKSVHRLLGAENEVYSISAQELRNIGVTPSVVNYMMAIRLDGDIPDDAEAVLLSKRKALVDTVLDFLDAGLDPELEAAAASRVLLFYGADRAHARMFAREYGARFRTRHMMDHLLSYRAAVERTVGRGHDPKRSAMRDEILAEVVRRGIREGAGWFSIPESLRTATDPADKQAHFEAMLEHAAATPAPVEVLTGEDDAGRIAEVLERARKGEVKAIANAQLLEDVEVPNVGIVVNTPTDSMLRCLQQAADLQRSGRTGFVVNPYYRVNDATDDYLRFFYEASGDVQMGRSIETDPVYFGDIDVTAYVDAPDETADIADDADAARPAIEGVAPVASATATDPDVPVPPGAAPQPDAGPAFMRGMMDKPRPRATRAFVPAPAPKTTPPPRNFTIRSDVDSVVRLTRQIRLKRDALPQDEDHLSLRQACAWLAVPTRRNGDLSRVYRLVEEDLLHGRPPTWEGHEVDAGIYTDGRIRWLGIHRDHVERIGKKLGHYPNLPSKTDHWLTCAETAAALSLRGNAYLLGLFEELASEWTTTGRTSIPGFSLVNDRGRKVFAVQRASLGLVEAEVARRRPAPVRRGDIRLKDAVIRLGAPPSAAPRVEKLWHEIVGRLRAGLPADEDENVSFRIARDGGREIGVVTESALPWLARRLGLRYVSVIALDPDFHAMLPDAVAYLGISMSDAETLKAAYDRLRGDLSDGRVVLVDGEPVSAAWVRTGSTIGFALPRDCLLALAREIGIEIPVPPFERDDAAGLSM